MPARRRKAANSAEGEKRAKKRPTIPSKGSDVTIHELYNQCAVEGSEAERIDHIREWEDKGAISEIILPFLKSSSSSKEFFHGCHLLVLFVDFQYWEGSFSGDLSIWEQLDSGVAIDKILETLLLKTESHDIELQSQIVNFVVVCLASNNKALKDGIWKHVGGIGLLHWVPQRRRELELKKSAGLRRKLPNVEKENMWIVETLQHVMSLLEGKTKYGQLIKIDAEQGTEEKDMPEDVTPEVWKYLHRTLELLIDLLSGTSSRLFLLMYMDAIHFNVRCRLAVGHRYAVDENLRLVQHLLGRINRLLSFPIDDSNQRHLTKVDVVSMHHARAVLLQKMAHRHFPEDLQQVIYAGVGLLCKGQQRKSYLERAFIGFDDDKLATLLFKMRLIPEESPSLTRSYLLQVLANYLTIPPYPMDQLRAYPLYPTETLLWDHSIIPPSNSQLRATQVLALPKLNAKFLSFQDYLLRNYELVRLESAYEIRADIVNVVKRVRPLLRQSNVEDEEETQLTTEFSGWSRMALELAQPFEIVEVQPPKLGQTVSSKIVAEITVDLDPCGAAIRREWDEIGEYDNLFLVAIDASKMSGKLAPYLKDYHLRHGSHKAWDSDSERRVPDEEDSTFPERFGITMVRGCMVVQVRNEEGTIMSDPGATTPENQRKGTKRVFKIVMDSAQYAIESKSGSPSEMYQSFNLVIRRHGRENNFKSILETVRGLLEGAGSIDRVIPSWLRSLVLGFGDPSSASYGSDTMKRYAMNTVGVNKPTDFLDFGDSFLDEAHLRASFEGSTTVDGRSKPQKKSNGRRQNYQVRFTEADGKKTVEAVSRPFPDTKAGNPVQFTPVQVEAIRSGLSPGLTLVVGPPGTGKTDVAVQIIASLFHSFPTQRTIIITHSNAALNDIFTKVMARGDIDERYFVRLGAGERDLETESTHDFTKIGRVAYSTQRRDQLLEKVQQLSESLGISGKAQRGADGSPSYTCETSEYFQKHHVLRRRRIFENAMKDKGEQGDIDVTSDFPFCVYFGASKVTLDEARKLLGDLDTLFEELAEYRPYELLRSQRQRADYLITKQARIVAMTCTHAAIARSHLIELGFEYDNIVMEESGQMLEIESFIPCLLQSGKADKSVSGVSRLKRVCMLGDHNQLPPVVKNASFSKFSNLDQSLFTRLIRLGVPYIQLDKQGRARPEIMSLYSWRYENLGNLDHVSQAKEFQLANPGFVHSFQMINVEDFEGKGESAPTPFYYQNLGEAEYIVALFQYMVLIGYNPERISILTTYNGQKELLSDILRQRCGPGTPLAGVSPKAISTVDQYQGQQNDIILLSLVRTKTVGHLRDIRRLVVAVSRARLGLYVVCREKVFGQSHELKQSMKQFASRPTKLQLVMGETYPTERKVGEEVPAKQRYEIADVSQLGSIVHTMQEDMLAQAAEGLDED